MTLQGHVKTIQLFEEKTYIPELNVVVCYLQAQIAVKAGALTGNPFGFI